jgi:hypothetical protein
MANLTVKFLGADGSVEKEKVLVLRGEGPFSFDRLLDALYSADLAPFASRLEAGNEFKVDNQDPRALSFSGRVTFKSTLEQGVGTGPSVRVSAMAQGAGAGSCDIPANSTVAAAFRRAGITPPANANIMLDGNPSSLDARIPQKGAVQISAIGAVKGGC